MATTTILTLILLTPLLNTVFTCGTHEQDSNDDVEHHDGCHQHVADEKESDIRLRPVFLEDAAGGNVVKGE